MMRNVVVAVAAVALPAVANAQGCSNLGAGSKEAGLLAFYSAPVAFTTAAQPKPLRPWQLQLTLEVATVPSADSSMRATTCYTNNKSESTNLTQVLGRPRLAMGLPFNFIAEVGYIPPITIRDATANLLGLSMAWVMQYGTLAGANVVYQVRAHTLIGDIKGPITCSRNALQPDPTQACYATVGVTQPSKDTYTPNVSGLEGVVALDAATYAVYLGVGYNSLTPKLKVDFTNAIGGHDTTSVTTVRLSRTAIIAGGTFRLTQKFDVTGQIYAVPDDLSMFRIVLAWRP
jgi:hypothetical protein